MNGIDPVPDCKWSKSLGYFEMSYRENGLVKVHSTNFQILKSQYCTAHHFMVSASTGKIIQPDWIDTFTATFHDGVVVGLPTNVKWEKIPEQDMIWLKIPVPSGRTSLNVSSTPNPGDVLKACFFDFNKSKWVSLAGVFQKSKDGYISHTIPTTEGYCGGAIMDNSSRVVAMHTNGAQHVGGPNLGIWITAALLMPLSPSHLTKN